MEASAWLYRRLLRLYPADFRAAYGEAALADFTDLCTHLRESHGPRGLASAWRLLARDLALSLTSEWLAAGAHWRLLSVCAAVLIFSGVLLSVEPGIRAK